MTGVPRGARKSIARCVRPPRIALKVSGTRAGATPRTGTMRAGGIESAATGAGRDGTRGAPAPHPPTMNASATVVRHARRVGRSAVGTVRACFTSTGLSSILTRLGDGRRGSRGQIRIVLPGGATERANSSLTPITGCRLSGVAVRALPLFLRPVHRQDTRRNEREAGNEPLGEFGFRYLRGDAHLLPQQAAHHRLGHVAHHERRPARLELIDGHPREQQVTLFRVVVDVPRRRRV